MSLGSDLNGHPIFTDGDVIRIACAPNEAKVIDLPHGNYQVIADGHGIWFGGAKGICLYSPQGALQKASDLNASLAGACA